MENKEENTITDLCVKPPKPYKTRCPICGSVIVAHKMRRHMRSDKHKDAIYVLQERFEMK